MYISKRILEHSIDKLARLVNYAILVALAMPIWKSIWKLTLIGNSSVFIHEGAKAAMFSLLVVSLVNQAWCVRVLSFSMLFTIDKFTVIWS